MAGFGGCLTSVAHADRVRMWLSRAGALLRHTPTTALQGAEHDPLYLILAQLPGEASHTAAASGSQWTLWTCGAMDNLVEVAGRYLSRLPDGPWSPQDRAHVVVALYQTAGPTPFSEVNGPFVVGFLDRAARTLRLFADGLGTGAVYYTAANGGLIFASELKALLAHPDVRRTVDEEGLAQQLAVDYPMGERTLYRDIRRLPGGTLLTFDLVSKRLTQERFWAPRFDTAGNRATPEECADELARRIRRAVQRDVADGRRIAVPLSGGLDSRILLGFAREMREASTFLALTTGHRHTYDVLFASRIAKGCGVPFRFVPIAEDYLARDAAAFAWLTDGMVSAHNGWQMGVRPALPPETDRLLSGYLGGVIAGFPPQLEELGLGAPPDLVAQRYLALEARTFPDRELATLLRPAAAARMVGCATEYLRSALRQAVVEEALDATRIASLLCLQPRGMGYFFRLYGSQLPMHTPLADQDVLAYWYTVPPAYRVKKLVYKLLIQRHLPRLAQVALDKTGLPLAPGSIRTALHRQWKSLVKYELPRWTGGLYRWHDRRAYAHYDEWMRRPITRRFVLETFARAGHRLEPWCDPARIQALVASHMSGAGNHYRQLSVLLTLALWFEQAEQLKPPVKSEDLGFADVGGVGQSPGART